MRKSVIALMIAACLVIGISASLCVRATAEKKAIKIGFAPSVYELTDYFGQAAIAIQQSLTDAGIPFEFIARAAEHEADVASQINIVEDMVTLGVDYIVVGPIDYWGIVPAIKRANKAGIPVIVINYINPHPPECGIDALAYCGYSHATGGRITGEWVADNLLKPGDEVAMMLGEPGNKASDERGLTAARIWEDRGMKIVYTHYGYWEATQAYDGTERILMGYPNVKLIYGVNSAMAMGVANAVHSAGLTGKVHVIGFGCVTSELDMIWEGLITAAIFRDAQSSGRDMADAIMRHLRGEPVPKQYELDMVMIHTQEDVLKCIPVEQLKFMENWPEIEKDLKARKKL